ncbi:MAG: DNA ligase-associated DEXH box helicase, partial [Acidobacteriota bacterium]|nr:DNA ligase-associated DEXH box helicase [Acidobacteriota bacterium]
MRPEGLFAPAFDAWIDPPAPAARAILSHGHADHAAAGHGEVWATSDTLAIYRRRNPG